MKKVIALAGVYDSGKTTVLNDLIVELKKRNASSLQNKTQIPTSYSGNDRREVLQWQTSNMSTVIIGICTGGDMDSIIEKNFAFFAGNHCDICITACRAAASSRTVSAVINESKLRFNLLPHFVAKMKTDGAARTRTRVDAQTVVQILDMIS